jgi:mannose-6-phosphate isomerase-like protein (cupin superfamily)
MSHVSNLPVIGSGQGKLWGSTKQVFSLNGIDAHVIHVEAGGFCSQHTHKNKWNRFVVVSGELIIKQWQPGVELPDVTVLSTNQICDIPPGTRHQFEALDDVCAVEFYWTTLDPEDIDRNGTVGGIRD